jgi:hypothetical protein
LRLPRARLARTSRSAARLDQLPSSARSLVANCRPEDRPRGLLLPSDIRLMRAIIEAYSASCFKISAFSARATRRRRSGDKYLFSHAGTSSQSVLMPLARSPIPATWRYATLGDIKMMIKLSQKCRTPCPPIARDFQHRHFHARAGKLHHQSPDTRLFASPCGVYGKKVSAPRHERNISPTEWPKLSSS